MRIPPDFSEIVRRLTEHTSSRLRDTFLDQRRVPAKVSGLHILLINFQEVLGSVVSERLPSKRLSSESPINVEPIKATIFARRSLYERLTGILWGSVHLVKVSIILALSQDKDVSRHIH